MTKTILLIIAAIVVIAAAIGFMTLTQAPSAPSQDIQAVSDAQAVPVAQTTPVYKISQEESKVSFSISEVLRGKDITAIGTTNQVAGDIVVNIDPESGAVHLAADNITINAKTFTTGEEKRDGALVRMILKSEDPSNEFITFKVTSVGLSDAPQMDVPTQFSVTGDLTISGVTKPVTLAGTLTANADKMLITASAKIKRADFNLKVPDFDFIASVEDEFTISADLVANRTQ